MLILTPAIQADIRDYQHFKSGERIDGMFGAVALIGSFVTMATSAVLPAVYEKYGIFEGNGYENMYDVLYDVFTLTKLIGVLVILSSVGAALNVVPYFFYDLTEVKQKAMIRILKIRAMFEDYGNGVLKDKDMTETMQMIKEAKQRLADGSIDIDKLKAEKTSRKEMIRAKKINEEYEISSMILQEIEKFTTEAAHLRLDWASKVISRGLEGIVEFYDMDVQKARELSKVTKQDKEVRKNAIADAKLGLRSKNAMIKYYPDGLIVFDKDALEELYQKANELINKKTELLKSKASREQISEISANIKQISSKIDTLEKEQVRFEQSTKVYHVAKRYVQQAENYARFGELHDKYKALLQST